MNILFFLIPKSEVAYIFEDETLRQTLEKMEHRKYSCIPILTMDGKYLGTISEGDLLWGMRRADIHDIKETEGVPIMAIPRRATYKPVHADSNMEDLLDRAINQNFVPVVDDQGAFIGIITRYSASHLQVPYPHVFQAQENPPLHRCQCSLQDFW